MSDDDQHLRDFMRRGAAAAAAVDALGAGPPPPVSAELARHLAELGRMPIEALQHLIRVLEPAQSGATWAQGHAISLIALIIAQAAYDHAAAARPALEPCPVCCAAPCACLGYAPTDPPPPKGKP